MTDSGVTRPDWLEPGAEVVVWTEGHGRHSVDVYRTKVARVAVKSFTVEGVKDRFDMRTLIARGDSAWDRGRFCAPLDSGQARAVLERFRRQSLTGSARVAVAAWDGKPTRRNRLAAIAALQAVEVDEET